MNNMQELKITFEMEMMLEMDDDSVDGDDV